MRLLILFFSLFLLYLQYSFWFGTNGWLDNRSAKSELQLLQEQKEVLVARNHLLKTEVEALSAISDRKREITPTAIDAVEERARLERGMVKPDEQFYRIIVEGK